MKCMLFPGSIINTDINEHRDHGSAPLIKSSRQLARGMIKCAMGVLHVCTTQVSPTCMVVLHWRHQA